MVSVATAVRLCAALVCVLVSHGTDHSPPDGVVAPSLTPSTKTSTCVTPWSSLAVPDTATTPATVEAAAGAVIATVGAVSTGGGVLAAARRAARGALTKGSAMPSGSGFVPTGSKIDRLAVCCQRP